jgi:hypothetical protein
MKAKLIRAGFRSLQRLESQLADVYDDVFFARLRG